MLSIMIIILLAFLINLPFGYMRKRSKKYSFKWFLAIHLPVPLIVITRLLFHVDYNYIPLFILSSIFGQILGGRIIN
jgi:hypothetical protein